MFTNLFACATTADMAMSVFGLSDALSTQIEHVPINSEEPTKNRFVC